MESLNIVYRYQNTSLTNDLVELLFMYSDQDVLGEKEILNDYKEYLPQNTTSLVFEHKDIFESFIQSMMSKLRLNKSNIITVDDYNLGLSNISHVNEIDSIFEKYGHQIETSEDETSQKGFFGKFFK